MIKLELTTREAQVTARGLFKYAVELAKQARSAHADQRRDEAEELDINRDDAIKAYDKLNKLLGEPDPHSFDRPRFGG